MPPKKSQSQSQYRPFHPAPNFVDRIPVRVLSVYDGDTCTIGMYLFGDANQPTFKFNARLIGIDTPEIKSKDDELKKLALTARDCVRDHVLDKDGVTCIFSEECDKYGRLLIRLFSPDGVEVNNLLVEKGYAKKYDGGTKESW
jgi:endonuclease YncB( thermonuclease family)